jgi:hypothetical protein
VTLTTPAGPVAQTVFVMGGCESSGPDYAGWRYTAPFESAGLGAGPAPRILCFGTLDGRWPSESRQVVGTKGPAGENGRGRPTGYAAATRSVCGVTQTSLSCRRIVVMQTAVSRIDPALHYER